MKILMVNKFHYRKGGSETYYFDVADGLRKMGHEVVCFAMDAPENEPCEQSEYFVSSRDYNGKTSILQKLKDAASLIYSKEAKRKFERLLQAEKPDVIHLNLIHRQITFSILDAPGAKDIPVVYTAHDYVPICPNGTMLDNDGAVCEECLKGSYGPCAKKKCVKSSFAKSALAAMEASYLHGRNVYGKINRIIAPSEFMRSKLLEGGFSPEQVITLQNFVRAELLERAESVDSLSKEKTFLFFGRLSKEKGVDVVVRAFVQATPFLPSWRLVIAGDGPERGAIEKLVVESGVAGSIELTGHLDATGVAKRVEKASFSIVSSRWRENMPYSIVESFVLGTPVIGTQIGGIPELVIQGQTGFLCEPNDIGSLTDAMLRSAAMRSVEYQKLQQNCRNYVVERCGQGAYMEALIDLYKRIQTEA